MVMITVRCIIHGWSICNLHCAYSAAFILCMNLAVRWTFRGRPLWSADSLMVCRSHHTWFGLFIWWSKPGTTHNDWLMIFYGSLAGTFPGLHPMIQSTVMAIALGRLLDWISSTQNPVGLISPLWDILYRSTWVLWIVLRRLTTQLVWPRNEPWGLLESGAILGWVYPSFYWNSPRAHTPGVEFQVNM